MYYQDHFGLEEALLVPVASAQDESKEVLTTGGRYGATYTDMDTAVSVYNGTLAPLAMVNFTNVLDWCDPLLICSIRTRLLGFRRTLKDHFTAGMVPEQGAAIRCDVGGGKDVVIEVPRYGGGHEDLDTLVSLSFRTSLTTSLK